MARNRHPSKEIEAAIRYAEGHGWICTLVKKGHAWGRLKCPAGDRSGCQMSVWSTPQKPESFAKRIRRRVDGCSH